MRVKLSFYHTITSPDNNFGHMNPFATNLLRLKAKKWIFLDFEIFPLHFLNKYAISNLRMKMLKNRVWAIGELFFQKFQFPVHV